jgi:hypothetical protein
MARTTQKILLLIPFLLLRENISGVTQKWVYMSQYVLFYLPESESVTNSDYVTEWQAGQVQLRLFEADGANMTLCYGNVWIVSKTQLMKRVSRLRVQLVISSFGKTQPILPHGRDHRDLYRWAPFKIWPTYYLSCPRIYMVSVRFSGKYQHGKSNLVTVSSLQIYEHLLKQNFCSVENVDKIITNQPTVSSIRFLCLLWIHGNVSLRAMRKVECGNRGWALSLTNSHPISHELALLEAKPCLS